MLSTTIPEQTKDAWGKKQLEIKSLKTEVKKLRKNFEQRRQNLWWGS
jgi:hypothetical protein